MKVEWRSKQPSAARALRSEGHGEPRWEQFFPDSPHTHSDLGISPVCCLILKCLCPFFQQICQLIITNLTNYAWSLPMGP